MDFKKEIVFLKNFKIIYFFLLIVFFNSLFIGCSSSKYKIKKTYENEIKTIIYEPNESGPFPAVIVLHTIAGLKPHVTDYAYKLSKEGYVTLVVEYFSIDLKDAYDHLKAMPNVDPTEIGIVGFSFGPKKALTFVESDPNIQIKAIISYYVGKFYSLQCGSPNCPPILFLHGDKDQETSPQRIIKFCNNQKELGKICEYHLYKGVKHAFDHKSRYKGYNPYATSDAYKRSVSFLNKYLKEI